MVNVSPPDQIRLNRVPKTGAQILTLRQVGQYGRGTDARSLEGDGPLVHPD